MLKYTLKRIGAMVPVMLIISVVMFLIIYLTPGDPASSMLGMEASADQIERVNDSLGLNEPPEADGTRLHSSPERSWHT